MSALAVLKGISIEIRTVFVAHSSVQNHHRWQYVPIRYFLISKHLQKDAGRVEHVLAAPPRVEHVDVEHVENMSWVVAHV
eukprot:3652125-Amphidinium_carterae.2